MVNTLLWSPGKVRRGFSSSVVSPVESRPDRPSIADATVLAIAILLGIVSNAFATDLTEPDPYQLATLSFRHFSDSDGLPQNTIQTINVDTRGVLWIGTQDGAAFYNGKSWRVVRMPGRHQSNFIRAILPASDGSIWFGTRMGGLFRRQGDHWTEVKPICAIPECERIHALLETTSAAGRPEIWAGTYGAGLARMRDGEWQLFTTADGLPSNRFWGLAAEETEAGTALWAGSEAGLAVLPPGADRFITEPDFPRSSVNSIVFEPHPSREKTMWVGSYGGGLYRRSRDVWTRLTTHDGLPTDFLTSLAVGTSAAGEVILWAGTDGGGLARISDRTIDVVDTASGLPSNGVYCVYEMRPQSGPSMLWVGTRNGGLAQLIDGTWKRLSPSAGSRPAPVNAILNLPETSASTSMWFGTDGDALFRLRGGTWTHFRHESPSPIVQCLLGSVGDDGSPTLWVGTRTGGLAQFVHGTWSVFSVESGALPSNMIQTLLQTRGPGGEAILWVGTRTGLARYENRRWTWATRQDGLPNESVLSLAETIEPDGSTALWAGTYDGLAVHRLGHWQPVALEPPLLNTAVQCLHEQRTGDGRRLLWIGTDGGGVSVLDLDQQPRTLFTLTDTTYPGLPNNVISSIVEDAAGRIYLLTNHGVARLSAIGPNSSSPHDYVVNTYSVEDGLPLNEGNRGAATVDHAGRIWVGTVGGAAVLDPRNEREDRSPDPLTLDVRSGFEPFEIFSPGVRLTHDRKHIIFNYALLSYFHEKQTRYKTQLIGLDDEPSPWSEDAKSEYRNLSKGRYVFRVWGRDFNGNISGPQEFAFEVRPALWESWWAYVIGVVFATVATFLIQRWRLRAVRDRERRLAALVKARTRRLEEANELLVKLSYADSLTGVGNRRRFDELLQTEWNRAVRSHQSLSLVLIDIDHFKMLNDRLGHAEGDRCLKIVAAAIADALPRSGDSVSRYGGDEFAIILPATDAAGALTVAEVMRSTVAALEFAERTSDRVTVSGGVGSLVPAANDDPHELLNVADRGLYQAKLGGRNRIAKGEVDAVRPKSKL